MSQINLLPWREERRLARTNQFYAMLGAGAVAALLVVLVVHMYFSGRIADQIDKNTYIEEQIAALETKIKEIKELEKEKASLISRMQAIETLQTSRPLIVHIFDELVTSLPEGIYLNEVKQSGNVLAISGVAQSNSRVSSFMRKLEASEWVVDPVLDIIETKEKEGRKTSKFTLRVTQISMEGEEDELEEIEDIES